VFVFTAKGRRAAHTACTPALALEETTMRKLACMTAALAAVFVIAAETPAIAAVGQCFDANGRPFGPPHDTDNPPYARICEAYRRGGHCTHVGAGWAESNCGWGRRYRYRDDRDDGYRYRRDRYDDDGYRYRRRDY
jgi:hypothetical protein